MCPVQVSLIQVRYHLTGCCGYNTAPEETSPLKIVKIDGTLWLRAQQEQEQRRVSTCSALRQRSYGSRRHAYQHAHIDLARYNSCLKPTIPPTPHNPSTRLCYQFRSNESPNCTPLRQCQQQKQARVYEECPRHCLASPQAEATEAQTTCGQSGRQGYGQVSLL